MVDAATIFRKNSFNDEDSANLAKVAVMFTNVADEEISAAESADFIISQMKAFGIEAENATHIIDSINAVSNNYAVSSGDLANSIGNMSAALAVGNNSFEQSLALLTSGTEVTRNANKVSRGLVSVQSRLNQTVDKSSDVGQKLTDWYEEHNIAIKDQDGQLRSLYDVLKDVAGIWPTLTKNEQAYYLNQQAGSNQSQNLAAILSNFETAIKATDTALESSGSATQENARYMESLNASVQQLKATFQDFANNVISKDLVQNALKLLNGVLELLNTNVGTTITQIGLLAGVLTGVISIGSTIASKFVGMTGGASAFSVAATAATTATTGLAAALKTAAAKAGPYAAAAAIILTIGYKLFKWWKDSRETLEDVNKKLDDNTNQLEINKQKIQQLSQTPWYDRTPEITDEIEALENENARLQEQIELLQTRKGVLEGEQEEEPKKLGQVPHSKIVRGEDGSVTETTESGVTHTYTAEEWEEYLSSIREQFDEFASWTNEQIEQYLVGYEDVLRQKLERGASLTNFELDRYQELMAQLDDYRKDDGSIDWMAVSSLDYNTRMYVLSLYELEKAYEATAQKSRTYAEQVAYTKSKDAQNQAILNDAVAQGLTTQSEYNNMIKVYTDYGMSYSDALAAVAKRFKDAIIALGNLNNVSDLANETIQNLVSQLTNAQTAYNSFTEDGNLSIDTLTDIRDAFSDVTGIDTYIDRLGAAGNTADDVREILGQLVEAKVKATFSTEQLAGSEATVVAKMLDDAGVANSLEVATRLIAEAKYDLASQNIATDGTIEDAIRLLNTEKNVSEDVRISFVNLVAQEKIFNNSTLDVSQKRQALMELYTAANMVNGALSFNAAYGAFANNYIAAVGDATEEEILNAFNQYSIDKYTKQIIDATNDVAFKDKDKDKGGTDGGGGSSKSNEDTKLTALKEAVELRKSELDLMDAQGASDTSRIEKIREIIKALQNQIDYMKKSGASQADINALIKEQLSYEDKIKDIYNEIIEAQKEALETRRDNLKSAFSTITDMAQDELHKIEELEDEINKKYDDKLDALEEANDALNDQIQLEEKLEALAKAKTTKKMVYSNGQFVYMDDIDSISAAQGELDALNREREQEQQKAEIEAQRKQELIDNRIEERKKEWQDYIDTWGSVVDNYEKQQDKLLASQIFGINLEEQNWQKRIGNAKKFADEYANIMSQISTIENIQSAASSGGGLTVDPSIDYSAKMLQAKSEDEFLYWSAYRDAKIQQTGSESKITSGKIRSNEQLYKDWKKVQGYAIGTYASKSGLAMLGESGPELGVLKGGTGILPADITKNLWAWGSTTPAQMMYALDSVSSQNSGGVNMNNVVLEFPNVRNGNDAKDFVTNVVNLAYQKAYKRA
nr:MAG TPA: minor tail protein [Caudoviricetes sp.]